MSTPTLVENPLRQTRRNNNDPRFRNLLNKKLPTRSWKKFGKTFLPAYGNSEVGKVGKKSKGLFGRFGTNKITGPDNTTTRASNEISANIITNARTTNYDLIRRLWRQYKGKQNDIDFIPRIDTLEKIGKFELELECFKNKDTPRDKDGRASIITRFIYLGYSAEEANTMLCNYTSESTPNDLKERLIALNLPIDPSSTIIDSAVEDLILPDELQKEKMKIVTNFIILRLILSDLLIVRLKSNSSKVVETSFGNLTTFGQVLKVASFLSIGVSIAFFVPGVLLNEFPQEYMDFENALEIEVNPNTESQLQGYIIHFYKTRYKTDASYSDMLQFAYNADPLASVYFAEKIKKFITDNNRLPTLDEENAIILETNNTFPQVPGFSKSINTENADYFFDKLWNINYKDRNSFIFKFVKVAGIHGSIASIKSVIIGATSWSVVGGAVLIRQLHALIKTFLSEKAKIDIFRFIDHFLLEFPVAINLIRNPDYIKSFSTDTTLNLGIQLYINEILNVLNKHRRFLSLEETNNGPLIYNNFVKGKIIKASANANANANANASANANANANASANANANANANTNASANANANANASASANANANASANANANANASASANARRLIHNDEENAYYLDINTNSIYNSPTAEKRVGILKTHEGSAYIEFEDQDESKWLSNTNSKQYAKGGRRSYRQKRRSATKKRKTQRKN